MGSHAYDHNCQSWGFRGNFVFSDNFFALCLKQNLAIFETDFGNFGRTWDFLVNIQ